MNFFGGLSKQHSSKFLEVSKSREQQHQLNDASLHRRKKQPVRMARSVRNTRANLVVTGSASFKACTPHALGDRTKSPFLDSFVITTNEKANDTSYEASRKRLNREAYAILKSTSTNIESVKSRINMDRLFELKSANTQLPKTPKSQTDQLFDNEDQDQCSIGRAETSSDEDDGSAQNVIVNLASIKPLTDANLASHNRSSPVTPLTRSKSLLEPDRASLSRPRREDHKPSPNSHHEFMSAFDKQQDSTDRMSVRSVSSLSDYSAHQGKCELLSIISDVLEPL